jgi:hypothetical protein
MVDPVSYSSSHASAPNGFVASYVEQAWHRLMLDYGDSLVEPVVLDPDGGPVTVTGRQFAGGGALKYGYTLRAGKTITEDANYVYAANNSPYDRIAAVVELTAQPPGDLTITITGTIAPRDGQPVPIAVQWNDTIVFEGDAPFEELQLGRFAVTVPKGAIRAGNNALSISNTTPNGPTGNRPWFGIAHAVLEFLP